MKTYKIKVKTLSPVFVGSGEKIKKKEYIFHKFENKVLIPDLSRMYNGLKSLGKDKKFETYLLDEYIDLYFWLKNNNIDKKQYLKWIKYTLDSGDAVFENKGQKEIHTFIKDSYNMPYIPGSSLKGAIRTALISENIIKNNNKFSNIKGKIERDIGFFRKRTSFLKDDINDVESIVLNKLDRINTKSNAVNDIMSTVKISDSKPLKLSDLTLCQKIDISLDGNQNELNVLRECLKPQTSIEFDLTIDSKLYSFDAKKIIDSINIFFQNYYECFITPFKRGKKYEENSFYLGGGVGFASKTIDYPMFGKKDGVKVVSEIIDKTISRDAVKEHKHYQDVKLGVSPHMLKCTKYRNNIYEMGLCKIDIVENKK